MNNEKKRLDGELYEEGEVLPAEENELVEGEQVEGEQVEDVQDGDVEPADDGAGLDELTARRQELESEISELERELERRRAETDKAAREYAEFRELYPDVDTDELAPEVSEAVEQGIPLAAAYALYEKRLQKRGEQVAAHNSANRGASFGSVGRAPEADFFTPDEVRGMTQSEVRANYQKILKSMKSWH